MTWAMRLKRVFNIDVFQCGNCEGRLKVIACIEDPEVIKRILNHLKKTKPEMFEDAQQRATILTNYQAYPLDNLQDRDKHV